MAEPLFTFEQGEYVHPDIRAFFETPQNNDVLRSALKAEKYKLSDQAQQAVLGIIRDVVVGKTADDEIASRINDETEMDFDAALELQADIVDGVFSDIVDQIEAQYDIYRDLHPEDFLPPEPPKRDATEQVAGQVLAGLAFSPADPVLRKRMLNIVISRLRDVRADADTLAILEKPTKTGGMGFTAEQAKSVLEATVAAAPGVKATEERVAAELKAYDEKKQMALDAKARREQSIASKDSRQPTQQVTKADYVEVAEQADVKEIEKAAQEVPKKVDLQEVQQVKSEIDKLVDEAVAKSAVQLQGEDLLRRYHNIVSLYVRDLRDDAETKNKLAAPAQSGGMGFAAPEVDRVIAVLMSVKRSYTGAASAKSAEERKTFVAQESQKQLNAADDEVRREQEKIDSVYAELIKRSGKVPKEVPAARPAAAEPPRVIPVTAVKPAPPQMPVQAPPPPPAAPPQQPAPAAAPKPATPPPPPVPAQKMPDAPPQPRQKMPAVPPMNLPVMEPVPPAPAMPAAPAPAKAAPSAPRPQATAAPASSRTVAPMTPAKPVMTDVTPTAQKLFGPAEELRAIGLKEFRQYSRDPREAIVKIKDKIDLLADQSFEKKTEGIKAWQASEANRTYLDLLRESLEGTPVSDVIAAREARGEATLSKPEFDAIMAMNRQLRFG
jgi:hypothetical protein